MPPKYASPYSLVKTPIEQNKFYSLFTACNKETKQIWLAKVVHQQAVEQLSLEEHVGYNEQVLLAMKQQETVIYVNQIFAKNEDTFIIQQKFEVKLSTYLQQKGKINCEQVQKIIKDVFKSLCDVYKEGYVHRNIRPQHIVLVQGYEESQNTWKLETFVLDNKQFPVDTPFTWKKQTASLQQQNQKQELGDELLDAQIVWNFGYLSLQLVAGNDFMKKKMVRDSDIQWIRVKELCSKTPNLYQLIQKCFRFKFNDRILLKKFFDLKIFDDCNRQGYSEYFLTASNFFKTKTFSSIQGSMSMKSVNMKSQMLRNNLSPSTNTLPSQPKLMGEITQSIEQEQDEFNLMRGNFLSGVVNYVNLIESNEAAKVQNENKSIVEFYFIKLSLMFLDKVSKSILTSKVKSEAQGRLNTKSNIVKRIKNTENRLLKQFEIDTKQNYTLPQLIPIFNKLCGYAYSRIKESCENNEKIEKVKALAYFGFAGIIVNMIELREVNKVLPAKKGQTCLEIFQKTSPQTTLKLSQQLITKYFKTAS